MYVIESGITIDSNPEQPAKARPPIIVAESGNTMVVILISVLVKYMSMEVIELENTMDVRLMQCPKHAYPINVTEFAMTTDVIGHFWNASSIMEVTVSGITRDVRLVYGKHCTTPRGLLL